MPKTDAEAAEPHFQHPQPQSQNKPAAGQIDTGQASTTDQLQDLTNRIVSLESQKSKIVFNTGLIGLYESVTTAPTGIPISPYDQVKIVKISGTTYIYIYDYNQKTGGSASNGWFRVAIA